MLTPEEWAWKEDRLRYWQQDGRWWCAVACPDPLKEIKGRKRPWWKHYGVRGSGKTRTAAYNDWRAYTQSADLVADIL